jgi:predicted phosphoribosyltransferase
VRHFGGRHEAFEAVRVREQAELERRERDYRGARSPLDPAGQVAILVDDGLATGATMEAAVRALRSLGARRVVVAVPVASQEALERIEALADEVVCLAAPPFFNAVGQWYADFGQTGDAEVRDLLARASVAKQSSRHGGGGEP